MEHPVFYYDILRKKYTNEIQYLITRYRKDMKVIFIRIENVF